jgi:hypothetical protein
MRQPTYPSGVEHPEEHACTKRCQKPHNSALDFGHTWYVSHEGIAFIDLLFTRLVVQKIEMQPLFN